MSKKIKLIFTMSILFNVLLVGSMAGGAYHMKRHTGQSWHKLKADLAPDTRDLVHATFKGKKDEIKPMFKNMREKAKAFEDILAAEEFDAEAYAVAANELTDLSVQISQYRIKMFGSIAAQLPPEERAKIAKIVAAKILGRHGGKRGGHKGKHGMSKHPKGERKIKEAEVGLR